MADGGACAAADAHAADRGGREQPADGAVGARMRRFRCSSRDCAFSDGQSGQNLSHEYRWGYTGDVERAARRGVAELISLEPDVLVT